jgi:tungstate transport system substrate-binding protein
LVNKRNVREWVRRLGCMLPASFAIAAALAVLPAAQGHAGDSREVVRLAVVNTPVDSGLLAALLPRFEAQSGYRVEIAKGGAAYERARRGEADLVISHYGKGDVEAFVYSGIGLWPRPVFASRLVMVGPQSDPAGIRGLNDPFVAMRRIVASESPFVLGKSAGTRYLAEMLLAGADDPARGPWFELTELSGKELVNHAREKGGYTVLAALGFARMQKKQGAGMEVMLDDPPLLQRVMVIVRVNPERIEGINAEGAQALETYLLSPPTQAAIAAFREPDSGRAMWSSAARHNHSKGLMRRRD